MTALVALRDDLDWAAGGIGVAAGVAFFALVVLTEAARAVLLWVWSGPDSFEDVAP